MLLALVCGACSKQPPAEAYVARVGEATLSQTDIAAEGSEQPEHLMRQYVSNWVMTEILFQEAQRKGFAASDDVVRQTEEARRRFTINAYLEKEIYGDDSIAMRDAELHQEFTSNPDAYRLTDDVVKMSFVIFDERDAANAFRVTNLRGTSWHDAVKATRADTDQQRHLLRVATGEYFSQAILYPEELWKIARTLNKEEISYVVKTNAGFCVAVVHDVRRQGDLPEFDYAKNQIRQRLILKRRNTTYSQLLERLRSKYDVDVRLASNDSTEHDFKE